MRLSESFEALSLLIFSSFFSGALCGEIDWSTMDVKDILFNTTTLTTG